MDQKYRVKGTKKNTTSTRQARTQCKLSVPQYVLQLD